MASPLDGDQNKSLAKAERQAIYRVGDLSEQLPVGDLNIRTGFVCRNGNVGT